MKYDIDSLITEVRICIDENKAVDVEFDDSTQLDINDIIRQKLSHAIRMILESAPISLIDTATNYTDAIVNDWQSSATKGYDADTNCYTLRLPSDYLRLYKVKMSDWKVPCNIATSDDSDVFLMQFSQFKGIRGNTRRPVAVETKDGKGDVMLLFGSNPYASLSYFYYIPMPKEQQDVDGEFKGVLDGKLTSADASLLEGDVNVYYSTDLQRFVAILKSEDTGSVQTTGLGIGEQGTGKKYYTGYFPNWDKYNASIGGKAKDGAVFFNTTDGKYYTYADSELSEFDRDTTLSIPEKLKLAVIYQAAGLTALTLGSSQFADQMFAIANSYIEMDDTKRKGVKENDR